MPPGVIGSTTDSESVSVGSSPTEAVLKFTCKKERNMEKDNDNMEPDPFKSQDLISGNLREDIVSDFKNYIYGYVKISTGERKVICG